ncbi:hypothetical protein [Virgisporangium aurantiacum]|uniref:Uncharacterized protein n=1 Tax=Virgisporangium aurantiacum TaxID=175570 RepID=A0A8J4DYI0_9ACTN|nr:hypothetical protein [Virgisporangium aurantiacum]GIJ54656.1 hypothetical protein Vau01_021720 [Virgisporangium aurantiacum]
MSPEIMVLVVAVVVIVVVALEMLTAVLPLIIVIAFVPPGERADLAELLAAADSSPKLRLWPALNAAVVARRRRRKAMARERPATM